MIRISGLKIKIPHTKEELEKAILKKAKGMKPASYTIVRRSVDARKKPELYYVYTLDVAMPNEKKLLNMKGSVWTKVNEKAYHFPAKADQMSLLCEEERPVIIGAGPAGLFAGLVLARAGFRPVIYERGECVADRTRKVEHFFATGELDVSSNIQFGEGGAGTFSDGKLNTLVKDKMGRNHYVLQEFVKHGAPEEIIYSAKPHIGTDILKKVVENIRETILSLGGEVHFSTRLDKILLSQDRKSLRAIRLEKAGIVTERACSQLILAIGHSARDTFSMLYDTGIFMTPKAFAIGVRVEHPASMIDEAMYGVNPPEELGAANYKLTHQCANGRGVYTFCMCPGGYVVNSSSEQGHLCVNGMSNFARDSRNSNSAVIVTITPEDYGVDTGQGIHPLAGIEYQRRQEKAAWSTAGGKIPVQLFEDFCKHRKSESLGEIAPEMKGAWTLSNVRDILPDYIAASVEEGIMAFGQKIRGYDRPDTLISGVEARTSSPLRIERNKEGISSIAGLYPCGEGAGYAGGITSAAMDGVKMAEMLALHRKV